MNIIYTILILYGVVCLILFFYLLSRPLLSDVFYNSINTNLFDSDNIICKIFSSFILIPIGCIFILFIFLSSPYLFFSKEKRKIFLGYKNRNHKSTPIEIPKYQFWMPHNDMFRPNENQVIYIENSFNPKINSFFERNYEKVKDFFMTDYNKDWCKEGLDFIYLPRAIQDLNYTELLLYNRPDITNDTIIPKKEILNSIHEEYLKGFYGNDSYCIPFNPILCQHIKIPKKSLNINQGFIHFKKTIYKEELHMPVDLYTFFPLNYKSDKKFWSLIRKYVANTGTNTLPLYSLPNWQVVPPEYDEEVQEIAKEIQERIKRLQGIGLNSLIINKLILPEVTLSKLRITKNFKIFLTDYNNTEIVMPTLSKALYFFYLRHPEGIPFNQLENHKEELFQIYKRITSRDDNDALKKSIEYLVGVQYNSVNEKSSRIKAAFVNVFDENIAQNYYITTIESSKHISLDRNLVIDEAGIVKL